MDEEEEEACLQRCGYRATVRACCAGDEAEGARACAWQLSSDDYKLDILSQKPFTDGGHGPQRED